MTGKLRSYLRTEPKSDPITWIQRHVSLRHDPTSAHDGLVHLEPYQLRPILAQYAPAVREVTIMAVEQSGKSACWRFPLLHKMLEYPAPRWIIYESDDKAAEINEEQFDPLLRQVPGLSGQLNRNTALKHRYNLPNGSTLDFSGAGSDITSKPKRDGVADELDTWPLTDDGIRQNLRNFRKRFRTFFARGEGCLVVVSSPSPRKKGEKQDLTTSIISEQHGKSDGGFWTLRCLKCNRLTMPSHATYNLQWECIGEEDDEQYVVESSIRLECPACGHAHKERRAQRMNDGGAYCTRDGKEIVGYSEHVGCQWGALACPRVFSWLQIARAQLAAGSTADMFAQADYYNSWRGIAWRPRAKEKHGVETLRKHCAPMPDPAILANVFFSADTQDNGWYWVARGLDGEKNLWHLAHGFVRTVQELKKAWDAEHLGIQPVMGIIDEGGHGDMPKYTRQLVDAEKGLYAYKGGAFGERWRNGSVPKTILASAKQYQADLLYYIYTQTDRTNCYWFLPPEETIDDEYFAHLAALQPRNRMKRGNEFENWEKANNATADHYFDCEKQMLVLIDVAFKELHQWRRPVTGLRRSAAKTKRRQAPVLEM